MTSLIRLSALLFLIALGVSAQEVYKTVDENGNVTYTDKPTGANSEKVEMSEPIVVPRVIFQPRPAEPEKPNTPDSYEVAVTHPTPEMHINPGTQHLPVQVSTDPNVHPEHQLVILDNGEPVEGMTIEYIINGTHQIRAQVLDAEGEVLGQSEPVTVYVHRPTVNSRKNIESR